MDLQLAEFRQIRGAGDLGRAAAALGGRRRAAWGRAARRRACVGLRCRGDRGSRISTPRTRLWAAHLSEELRAEHQVVALVAARPEEACVEIKFQSRLARITEFTG